MFDEPGEAIEWSEDCFDSDDVLPGEPDLDSMPAPADVPEAAWAGARRFEPGDPESDVPWIPIPDWCVIDGEPYVAADAAAPKDACEQAAVWTQERLDGSGSAFRRAERDRKVDLLTAFTTAMQDLRSRFGLRDGSELGHGAKAFHRQVALDLGLTAGQVRSMVESATAARRRLPATWAVFLRLGATWRAVEIAVDESDGLDPDVLAEYDAAAAGMVGSVPLARLGKRVRVLRERLQDDAATARARTTEQRRAAVFREGRDGAGSLTLAGPVAGLRARLRVDQGGDRGEDR